MSAATAPHETLEARASYAADAYRAGMAETIWLLRHDQPASALRRIAETTEREVAILGHPGIKLPVAAGMARVRVAHRTRREARHG